MADTFLSFFLARQLKGQRRIPVISGAASVRVIFLQLQRVLTECQVNV